jgi:hypothetical protein
MSKSECEGNAAEAVYKRAFLLNHVSVPYLVYCVEKEDRSGKRGWFASSQLQKTMLNPIRMRGHSLFFRLPPSKTDSELTVLFSAFTLFRDSVPSLLFVQDASQTCVDLRVQYSGQSA